MKPKKLPMKRKRLSFFTLLILCGAATSFGQSLKKDIAFVQPLSQPPLSVEVQLTVENNELNYYSLSWNDPFSDSLAGASATPYLELQCFIRDSKGGLTGYYDGISQSGTKCHFKTTDSIVEVIFQSRPISAIHLYKSGPTRIASYVMACYDTEFRSVRISLNGPPVQQLALENNTDIVGLNFRRKGALFPDPMPCKGCCDYDMAMSLSRYYVSMQTGQIMTGKKWVARKGVEKILHELRLVPVDPGHTYLDMNQQSHSGWDLIREGKIDLLAFDPTQFYFVYFPY